MLHAGLILALCFSLNACGTIARSKKDSGVKATYYQGTHFDLTILGLTAASREHHFAGTIFCVYLIVCPFLVIASVPVDLAIDTVLLPADYYQSRHKRNEARREGPDGAVPEY